MRDARDSRVRREGDVAGMERLEEPVLLALEMEEGPRAKEYIQLLEPLEV